MQVTLWEHRENVVGGFVCLGADHNTQVGAGGWVVLGSRRVTAPSCYPAHTSQLLVGPPPPHRHAHTIAMLAFTLFSYTLTHTNLYVFTLTHPPAHPLRSR
jgi:hypothetical protein